MGKMMNEELRLQRVAQYGSFLYCPMRDVLCFARFTDEECAHDSCILDDPEYIEQKKRIERNIEKRNLEAREDREAQNMPPRPKARSEDEEAWCEIHAKEAVARKMYKKNKPKVADALMAEAMFYRRQLNAKRMERERRL